MWDFGQELWVTQKSTFPTVCTEHLHTSLSRSSSSIVAVYCRFLLRGIQNDNETRMPQFPNSACDLCEGLDPCSWAVPGQSRQLSFHWWIYCIISLPGPISYAVSVWEDTIFLGCAMAMNLVLGSSGHSSSHLMVVFLLDDFMDDFITDEGESCLPFEHKGTIQTFCEGWSTTVNKVAACGSNN